MICDICEREIAPGGLYVPGDPPRHLGCEKRARPGDMVPVLIEAGDGPTVVWHTPREYADLWDGVDELAAEALTPEPVAKVREGEAETMKRILEALDG